MNWIKLSEEWPQIGAQLLLHIKIKGEPRIQLGQRLNDTVMGPLPWFRTDIGILCGAESVTHWCEIEEPKE